MLKTKPKTTQIFEKVEMYTSYLADIRATNFGDLFDEHKAREKGLETNGESWDISSILCTNSPWTYITEVEDEEGEDITEDISIASVKFSKSLNDIFLDEDFVLESFVDKVELENCEKEIEEYQQRKEPYPISNFIKYGLKNGNGWYGCYVTEVKPEEILSIDYINQLD